jgi:hypothetical protein
MIFAQYQEPGSNPLFARLEETMSTKISWKTTLTYGCAILLGILLGPFVAGLAGGLRNSAPQIASAQSAAAQAAAAQAPDSPDIVYTCTPSFIGTFPTRVHVLCTVAAPGGIFYFASPTSDSKMAARVLSIMLTAKALGKNLQIYYNASGNGSAYGCQTNDCRPIDAIEMMN